MPHEIARHVIHQQPLVQIPGKLVKMAGSRASPFEGPTLQDWGTAQKSVFSVCVPGNSKGANPGTHTLSNSFTPSNKVQRLFSIQWNKILGYYLKPVELQADLRVAAFCPLALSASFSRKPAKQDGVWNWRLSHPPPLIGTSVTVSTHPEAGRRELAGHTF